MSEERWIAEAKGIQSPIWDTMEETHWAYNENLTHLCTKFDKERDAIVVASHNRESCNLALGLINQLNLVGSNIIIGQLKGFSDSLTFELA